MYILIQSVPQVAVKTVVATGKTFHERLQQFETEAAVGWTASHATQDGLHPHGGINTHVHIFTIHIYR